MTRKSKPRSSFDELIEEIAAYKVNRTRRKLAETMVKAINLHQAGQISGAQMLLAQFKCNEINTALKLMQPGRKSQR